MHLPDPNEVLERGRLAQELLDNPTFIDVINDLSAYHLAAICAAKPGEASREAREYHHTLHYALSEITGELVSRTSTAAEMAHIIQQNEDDQ